MQTVRPQSTLVPRFSMLCTAYQRRFELVTSDQHGWDAYVRQHPRGSIFHTSAMIRAMSAGRCLQPQALAAVDHEGQIIAMLVSCHVSTLPCLPSFSSRAVQYAEPLCDATQAGVAALGQLLAAHEEAMRGRAVISEVRLLHAPNFVEHALQAHGYQHREFINFLVDLRAKRDRIWRQVDKRLRQKIRATLRRGIEIRDDNSLEGVGRLYSLLQYSYGRARVPLMGREVFEAALEHLPSGQFRLRTAFDGHRPIAAILSLVYGDRVLSWYGGTLRINGLSPFACIAWDDIAWGCDRGYQYYDFGGAGWPHEDYGPRKFKASFGGVEVRYGRYLRTYSKF